ncbi:MAG: dihydroorotate dehydrogenase-like protein, partial [Phycisphaerae bacterium]|nr:dihydroorotate dehydrogenase-like protein [Phycisphaerae bacterium]
NRLPLRWIAIMHGRVDASLAATTGIHSGEDLARAILAGADVAMSTSALLTHGLDHAKTMLDGLTAYMDGKEYESVQQMKGVLSQKHCAEPAAFERANYMKTLGSIDLTRTFE